MFNSGAEHPWDFSKIGLFAGLLVGILALVAVVLLSNNLQTTSSSAATATVLSCPEGTIESSDGKCPPETTEIIVKDTITNDGSTSVGSADPGSTIGGGGDEILPPSDDTNTVDVVKICCKPITLLSCPPDTILMPREQCDPESIAPFDTGDPNQVCCRPLPTIPNEVTPPPDDDVSPTPSECPVVDIIQPEIKVTLSCPLVE